MINEAIRKAVLHEDLTAEEMREVVGQIMDGGASDITKTALMVALRMKGETVEEITGAATAMRDRVVPVVADKEGLIDTCGTGGDGRGTFNVSTVAALVAAGAGVRVAKHGNRAVSSSCGSADVLRELGVAIDLDAGRMAAVLDEVGISFLFAPTLHPAMASVAPIRRELGMRTIFNVLGPLTNPAFARRQIMGIFSPALVEIVARVLASLGSEHVLVVHSDDGLDEISVSAPTRFCELKDGEIRTGFLEPEEIDVQRCRLEDVIGGDAASNAKIARDVLEGRNGAPRQIVLANAGAAIYVAGRAESIREGVALAAESIDSGAARAKLEALISATNGGKA
jgi:anthranilate phosphoribosyltransferase